MKKKKKKTENISLTINARITARETTTKSSHGDIARCLITYPASSRSSCNIKIAFHARGGGEKNSNRFCSERACRRRRASRLQIPRTDASSPRELIRGVLTHKVRLVDEPLISFHGTDAAVDIK